MAQAIFSCDRGFARLPKSQSHVFHHIFLEGSLRLRNLIRWVQSAQDQSVGAHVIIEVFGGGVQEYHCNSQ